ncbi:MAG TPA: hypothetical protein VF660_01595 [Actinomycetota bacterium]
MSPRSVAFVFAASVIAVSCGGGAEDASTVPTPTAQGTSNSTVSIVLLNYSVTPNPTSVPPGNVTFDIKVKSGFHAFAVLRTDFPHDKLPLKDVQADTFHEGIELVVANGVSSAPRKVEAQLTKPGKYVLLCNINDHYKRGMSAAFTVTGS